MRKIIICTIYDIKYNSYLLSQLLNLELFLCTFIKQELAFIITHTHTYIYVCVCIINIDKYKKKSPPKKR